jgi:hypothetical protein
MAFDKESYGRTGASPRAIALPALVALRQPQDHVAVALALAKDRCLSFDPRPLADLDAAILAEDHLLTAIEEQHVTISEHNAAQLR